VLASAFPFLFTCSLVQILCTTASSGLDAGARHWLFAPAALAIDIYSVFGPAGRALEVAMAWEVGVSDGVELGDEGEKVGGGRGQRAKEGRRRRGWWWDAEKMEWTDSCVAMIRGCGFLSVGPVGGDMNEYNETRRDETRRE
jgi:hypothetical protein